MHLVPKNTKRQPHRVAASEIVFGTPGSVLIRALVRVAKYRRLIACIRALPLRLRWRRISSRLAPLESRLPGLVKIPMDAQVRHQARLDVIEFGSGHQILRTLG